MAPELTSISTCLSYNIKTKKEQKRKRITFEFDLMKEIQNELIPNIIIAALHWFNFPYIEI